MLLAFIVCPCFLKAQQMFTVMSYNIENAFDTQHDEGKNDYEFCENGEKRWNKNKLFKKLKGISKVIVAADEERPLDLIGLCEVENDTVMHYLTKCTPLAHIGYKYIMTNSQDERGIDVALLYSPFTFHPIDIQSIRPQMEKGSMRDILHVAGIVTGGDTVDVYVVHLPSKRGGVEAHRRSTKVVELLKENVDSIRTIRVHSNIIVMGDFNAEPRSPQLKTLTNKGFLTNQMEPLKPGTYKYQGEWITIDHILTYTTTFQAVSSQILTLPFLIEKDNTYGGYKPHRTYLGPAYKGGISDHLPVFTRFEFLSNHQP